MLDTVAWFEIAADDPQEAERVGGEVVFALSDNAGGPDFGHIRDTAGNLFGVFALQTRPVKV